MDIITANVGQGSLSIVRNGGSAIVVDARMPGSNDQTVGNVKQHLATFLKDHVLRGVVLTGFDKDHADVRCLAILLRKYRPEWVLFPDYDKETHSYEETIALLRHEEQGRSMSTAPLSLIAVTLQTVATMDLASLAPGFEFDLFSPCEGDMTCSNNSSIVLKVTGNDPDGFSYLVTGDTENERWVAINKVFGSRLAADVLAAPHHGARNANNAESLLLIRPNTILISAGCDNCYGHPDPGVVGAYTRVARHVFSTHTDGGQSLHTKRLQGDFRTIAFT